MNNFNKNIFNNNPNQTRIVSNYNQVSKDGGRVSVEDIRKRMGQLKSSDVNIVVTHSKMADNASNQNFESNLKTEPKVDSSYSMNQNQINQARVANDRINSFRNFGK